MRGSEIPGVFVCAAIAVLCLALAIVLFTGRGAFLVAGYNMATPEERALYDERKLSRSVGCLMVFCAVFATVMALACWCAQEGLMTRGAVTTMGTVGALLLVSVIGGVVWYANTRCFRRPKR